MKISKFVWSVLVALVALRFVAPQQAEASKISSDGEVRVECTGGDCSSGATSHSFSGGVTIATEIFQRFLGAQQRFMQITWTGSGSSTVLVGGPVMSFWSVAGATFGAHFDLRRLTFSSVSEDDFS